MAYQLGSANDVFEVVTAICNFAATLGWTVNRNGMSGSDQWAVMTTPGGQVFQLLARSTNFGTTEAGYGPVILIAGTTGYDSGGGFTAQPGSSYVNNRIYTSANRMPGPFQALHLFGTAEYVHCVVEVTTGNFRHLLMGNIEKYGAWTGGEYVASTHGITTGAEAFLLFGEHSGGFSGTFSDSWCMVRAVADSMSWRYYNTDWSDDVDVTRRVIGARSYRDQLLATPNKWNSLPSMLPIVLSVPKLGGLRYPLGHLRDVRAINMGNLQPSQSITLGSDEWMVFPGLQRNSPTNYLNSGDYGYAYRKVT